MGTADLITSFTTRKHILTVSTYQMMILLLFNSAEKLSYTEIKNATDIPEGNVSRKEGILLQPLHVCVQAAMFFLSSFLPSSSSSFRAESTMEREEERQGEEFRRGVSDSVIFLSFFPSFFFGSLCMATDDLKRSLQSLACVKSKNVLKKSPMSKEINEIDEFCCNESFTNKYIKVKIGTVSINSSKESEAENTETRQKVEEDRKPQVEAALVRIMKARRVMNHNDLIAEVLSNIYSFWQCGLL